MPAVSILHLCLHGSESMLHFQAGRCRPALTEKFKNPGFFSSYFANAPNPVEISQNV